jgi:hypothetical protein
MELVRASFIVFCLAKIGKNFIEAPASISELPPNVEVLRLSADIDQSIDRTGPAENLATRRDDLAVVTSRLRLGLVAPIEPAIAKKLAKAERNMKPRVRVAGARFQQKYAMPTGRSKPIGQNAPRAAGPHNNVIERL